MSDQRTPSAPLGREQSCSWCGESMGFFVHSLRHDGPLSCGKRECNRFARETEEDMREEAHAELDRQNGWDR